MVSEDEFIVAMLSALFFGAWTIYLLLRTRSLKKRLKFEVERSLQIANLVVPPPAPALPAAPERSDELVELRKRVQVLERITVEKEHSLAREIEELRHA